LAKKKKKALQLGQLIKFDRKTTKHAFFLFFCEITKMPSNKKKILTKKIFIKKKKKIRKRLQRIFVLALMVRLGVRFFKSKFNFYLVREY
jgi:hypothetical protein